MSSSNSNSDRPWRVVVVGGGVSGLAAAFRLQELAGAANRPIDLTVCEASNALGGIVGTRDIAGYRVEMGADSFITNKPGAINLCRRLGLEDELIPTDARYRRSLVLSRGKPLPVPDGFQLLAPNAMWPVWKSPIFSLAGKLRLAAEYFLPAAPQPVEDESLASFVRRRFGQEALERLVQPLVGGIYTSDPEKLSLRGTMPRFLDMEAKHGSLIRALRHEARNSTVQDRTASGARYGLFATPRLGISQMVDALIARVRTNATIRLNCVVNQITPATDGTAYHLELADGTNELYDAVVVATPAYRAASVLRSVCPAAAGALDEIEYASTAIVVSGHRLSDVANPLDAFGLVVPAIEKRKILAVSFTSRKFPGRAPEGCVELRTFVGGAMQPELVNHSDDQILELVRQELRELLGVVWKPDFAIVARWTRSMPQYHVGHLGKIARIEADLKSQPRLGLAGNALYGVGLPDTIASGERAAERVFQG